MEVSTAPYLSKSLTVKGVYKVVQNNNNMANNNMLWHKEYTHTYTKNKEKKEKENSVHFGTLDIGSKIWFHLLTSDTLFAEPPSPNLKIIKIHQHSTPMFLQHTTHQVCVLNKELIHATGCSSILQPAQGIQEDIS